jgi:hypothetical protein
MSSRTKKIKPKLTTPFSNCKMGFTHTLVYVKGWGYRCKYCGKVKSDCTGQVLTELTKDQSH